MTPLFFIYSEASSEIYNLLRQYDYQLCNKLYVTYFKRGQDLTCRYLLWLYTTMMFTHSKNSTSIFGELIMTHWILIGWHVISDVTRADVNKNYTIDRLYTTSRDAITSAIGGQRKLWKKFSKTLKNLLWKRIQYREKLPYTLKNNILWTFYLEIW